MIPYHNQNPVRPHTSITRKKSRNGKEPVNSRTGKEPENKRTHQSAQLLLRVGSSAAKWRASCRFVLTAGCISLSFHQRAHIFVGTAEVHVSLHSHYSRVHISCIPCHQLSSQQISLTPVTRTRDSCVAKLWETPWIEPRCRLYQLSMQWPQQMRHTFRWCIRN